MLRASFVIVIVVLGWSRTLPPTVWGQDPWQVESPEFANQFAEQARLLQENCLRDIQTLEQWQEKRDERKRQLREMLGLDPLPPRTDLAPQVTAVTEHDEFTVERLHFQSLPGLYVTGNLYLPRHRRPDERLPAILYVCGHGQVKEGDVSFGNKVHYQHHGAWFARNGYVCLTIDTLQLGEIEGKHHGTHRYGMWWWLNRGYTPAGVEAWNCMRALDYLEARPEVDSQRFGVTGRSGGGAYSWWIAALDERIRVAVPVAGITDLQNHIVDGCVEGHCDCMFIVNTYRWDYPMVAALVAPRPLLISNTDRDSIFPLDGVVRTHAKVRQIYDLYGASENLALQITAGPHADTQELHLHAFRWFNHFLKQDDTPVEKVAAKYFTPAELQVFVDGKLPSDERCTSIEESFVALAPPLTIPADAQQWSTMRRGWMQALRDKVFGGWDSQFEPLELRSVAAVASDRDATANNNILEFRSESFRLQLPLLCASGLATATHVDLFVVQDRQAAERQQPAAPSELTSAGRVAMWFAPRGRDLAERDGLITDAKWTQMQRRYYLLGQSLDGQRVWDLRAAIQGLRRNPLTRDAELTIHAQGTSATIALFAALFEPSVTRLDLQNLPIDYRDGPYFLNVSRVVPLDAVVAMARERCDVSVTPSSSVTHYADEIRKCGFHATP